MPRMRTRRARRALLIAIVILCALASPMAIRAAFTSDASRTNHFRSRDMIFSVHVIDEFDRSDPYDHKRVSATNDGDVPAFVRILVHPVAILDGEPLDVRFGRDLVADFDIRDASTPTAHWAQDEFGRYYYLHRLAPGETAPPLFTRVQLADTADADLEGATLIIQVQIEAVAAGNKAYRTAWFATPTARQIQIRDWLDAAY